MKHHDKRIAFERLLTVLVLLFAGLALAGNIDPDADGSRYAYAENLGWLNAAPSGAGGPGVQVDDFRLLGWMWGENVGWVSLSCVNTSSCSTTSYRVTNDGNGGLAGFAWSENVGWVNFSPATAGVTIDPTTGEFAGRAWGENVGWISFASGGASSFRMKTAWKCDPVPAVPTAPPALFHNGETDLGWTSVGGATGYDVVYGRLSGLRSGAGDFTAATAGCVADKVPTNETAFLGTPVPGDGFWFLVRAANCGGDGTYDTGVIGQAAPRDAAIAGSGLDCP